MYKRKNKENEMKNLRNGDESKMNKTKMKEKY